MIQMRSILEVADNSGAKKISCIPLRSSEKLSMNVSPTCHTMPVPSQTASSALWIIGPWSAK